MRNNHSKIGNTHINKNIIYIVPQKIIHSEMTTAYFSSLGIFVVSEQSVGEKKPLSTSQQPAHPVN